MHFKSNLYVVNGAQIGAARSIICTNRTQMLQVHNPQTHLLYLTKPQIRLERHMLIVLHWIQRCHYNSLPRL